MSRFGRVVGIERQRCTLRVMRMRADPGILVGETPGLKCRAARMREARPGDLPVDLCLSRQVLRRGSSIRVDRERHIHLGDVHLHPESSKALDVLGD